MTLAITLEEFNNVIIKPMIIDKINSGSLDNYIFNNDMMTMKFSTEVEEALITRRKKLLSEFVTTDYEE